MAEQSGPQSKPFPGSPTGNRSPSVADQQPQSQPDVSDNPGEFSPGSPTGNASGTGSANQEKNR
jgi:hypothetical protein